MKELYINSILVNGGLEPILSEHQDLEFFKVKPTLSKEDYNITIDDIMKNLITDDLNCIAHIRYTLEHKLAIMALSYELLGYISRRILLHDSEKLVLYTMMNTTDAHILHRKYSLHHHNNFDAYSSLYQTKEQKSILETNNLLECILDYECSRYTKPDKPLNAFDTIKAYFPEDYRLQKQLLEKYDLNSSEYHNCTFEKFNSVAHLYLPLFKVINLSFIENFSKNIKNIDIQKSLYDFNLYLSSLSILSPNENL